MRRALILAHGEPPPAQLLRDRRRDWPLLVCTDGAAETALALGERPDLVVGDLDSLSASTRRALATTEVLAIAEQETTDLEKALYTLLDRGIEEVLVLGAGGQRWDQFHGNLSLFASYCDRLDIQAEDAAGLLRMARPGRTDLALPLGAVVSLLPLGWADGVTTHDLRWPLVEARLELGGRLGVSNEVSGSAPGVTYRGGCLGIYVVSTRPRPE